MSEREDVGDPALERREFEALNSFQREMWIKLKENRHKGAWETVPVRRLMNRLWNELQELQESLHDTKGIECPDGPPLSEEQRKKVVGECADVANFAMMIADVIGGLK